MVMTRLITLLALGAIVTSSADAQRFRFSDAVLVISPVDYDLFGDQRKLHFGLEGSISILGLETGPTLIFEKGKTTLAASITPYIFLIIIPYYTHTFDSDGLDLSEWGLCLKSPIRADGQKLFGHL
jgi:hypothetical protein